MSHNVFRVFIEKRFMERKKGFAPLGLSNIKNAQAGISSKELEVCKEVLRKIFKNLTH